MYLQTLYALSLTSLILVQTGNAISVPSSPPSSAKAVDPSLLSISLEFFAFPGYTQLAATTNCLNNIAALRGTQPAIRIGGTTQYVTSTYPSFKLWRDPTDCRLSRSTRDRATFDANLGTAVNYTVASPADAPASLTFGPQFITLASQLSGQVTLGLNRQLNNQPASLAAAKLAKQDMRNLFAIELGNEPEC